MSVLTLGELRKGIEKLADTKRRVVLNDWVETELLSFFVGRVLFASVFLLSALHKFQACASLVFWLLELLS